MLDIDYIRRKNLNNIIGKKIDYYDKITSTHKEIQTEGIGTKGRSWHTGERKKYSNDNYFETKM